jgi:hypothetical protein
MSLQAYLRRPISIICPTPHEENRYGFDGLIEQLPAGRVFAVQFKRPLIGSRCAAKFLVRQDQCNALLSWFNPKEAYYVFSPYPITATFVAQRTLALRNSAFVDVHNLSWVKGTASKTVKYLNPMGSRQLQITDPRRYVAIKGVSSWEEIQENINQIGRVVQRKEELRRMIREDKKGRGKTYYIHIPSKEKEAVVFT